MQDKYRKLGVSVNLMLKIVGISNFRISGQFLIKGNCHNSRISDDIDIGHKFDQ